MSLLLLDKTVSHSLHLEILNIYYVPQAVYSTVLWSCTVLNENYCSCILNKKVMFCQDSDGVYLSLMVIT